jgi:hypothetical protein
MNRSGRVWFLAVLCAGVGCAQVDEPAAPEANPAQAAPEVAQAGDAPEAEPAAESSPAATPDPAVAKLPALRAVWVQDKLVACHQDGATVPGAECPVAAATLVLAIDPSKPGARTVQSAQVRPGECGYGERAEAGEAVALGDAPKVEVLARDSTQYRALIAPAVGIADPASPGFIIDQLLRVDLDGDGAQEVLFSAQQKLGLRRVAGGDVETVLLPDPRGEDFAGVPQIVGLVDVEGDGSLEVVAGTGSPLAGLGPQWVGHWVIDPGPGAPKLQAVAGCEQEGPPRPGSDH